LQFKKHLLGLQACTGFQQQGALPASKAAQPAQSGAAPVASRSNITASMPGIGEQGFRNH